MRTIFLIIILNPWSISSSYGLYGHITKDTTWSDTVLATGDVVVDSGVVLTILPGTKVIFKADTSEWDDSQGYQNLCDLIISRGQIIAAGTISDSVMFTGMTDSVRLSSTKYWGGIRLLDGTLSQFRYTEISYTQIAIYSRASEITLENCYIGFALITGLYLSESKSNITNSIFLNIGNPIPAEENGYPEPIYGIYCKNPYYCKISENLIADCYGQEGYGSLQEAGDGGDFIGIFIEGNNGGNLLKNNTVSNCQGGLGGYGGTPIPFSGNGGNCIGLYTKGMSLLIEGNSVIRCGGGSSPSSMAGGGAGGDGFGFICESENTKMSANRISEIMGGRGDYEYGTGIGIFVSGKNIEMTKNIVAKSHHGYGIGVRIENEGIILSNNRLFDNGIGISIGEQGNAEIGGKPERQNDIFNSKYYNISNRSPNDITATYNWWGSVNRDTIENYIYDHNDDSLYGYVIYEPWAEDSLGIGENNRSVQPAQSFFLKADPNPFNRMTEISIEYGVGSRQEVRLNIYDLAGRPVKSFNLTNYHSPVITVVWDGRDDAGNSLPAGVYFCELDAKNSRARITKKLVLLR